MKNIKLLLVSVILSLILVGCMEYTYTEAEAITIRLYTETKESGLFTVKHENYSYIEYTFEYDGEIILDKESAENIIIGDKTIVIVTINENGNYHWSKLQLSIEDYKKLYGMDKE